MSTLIFRHFILRMSRRQTEGQLVQSVLGNRVIEHGYGTLAIRSQGDLSSIAIFRRMYMARMTSNVYKAKGALCRCIIVFKWEDYFISLFTIRSRFVGMVMYT